MVLLKFFGGPAKIVAKYGTQLPLMVASMGVISGSAMWGYSPDVWLVDFTEDPEIGALWIFDNLLICEVFGDYHSVDSVSIFSQRES